jgi:hypothetical protein
MHARIVVFDLKEVRSTAGGAALYVEGNDVVTYGRLLGGRSQAPAAALSTGTGLAYGRHGAP